MRDWVKKEQNILISTDKRLLYNNPNSELRRSLRPMRPLDVSESYQNYQNGAVSNQLTDLGRVGECVGATANRKMCDKGGCIHATV
jgi:hypothetical protein